MNDSQKLNSFNGKSQRLFFLHIPKAAGTTFKQVLDRHYGCKEIAWIDGSHHDESVRRLLALPQNVRERYRCIMGHFQFGLHKSFNGPFVYVTFLREPVARVTSLYYHIVRNSPHHILHRQLTDNSIGLADFVKSGYTEQATNSQTRWISGDNEVNEKSLDKAKDNIIKYFAVAGTTEEFDQSLVLVKHRLGLNNSLCYESKNMGKYQQSEVNDETRHLIKQANHLDCQLYAFVKERLATQWQKENNVLEQQMSEFKVQQQEFNCPSICNKLQRRCRAVIQTRYRNLHSNLQVR